MGNKNIFNKDKKNKLLYFFLRQTKGINLFRIKILATRLGYSFSHSFNNLDKEMMGLLLNSYYTYGENLNKQFSAHFEHFFQKISFKSARFLEGKPIHGQRTKTNAQTVRRLSKIYAVEFTISQQSKQNEKNY